jgi:hypothetical protein
MPEWLLRLHFTDKTIAKWAEVIGESAKVSANVEKEGLDQIAAMREKLSEEARKLDHPKPIFGLDEEMAQTKSKTKKLQDADALVRVGNFLGTSKDAINNIAQEQLLVAKQSRDYLRTIATRAPAYQGDVNDTFYPVA